MKDDDKNNIKDYTKEELDSFKIKEQLLIENGETSLEALLNVPFKNKEKVHDLLDKVNIHTQNIKDIENRITELSYKTDEPINDWYGGWSLSGSSNVLSGSGYVSTLNGGSTYNNYIYNSRPQMSVKLITVNYISDNNVICISDDIIDDVFQSVLGEYYLHYVNGSLLPLNRVIEIEPDSNVGIWFEKMCKNFERESKLKRVIKND